MFTKPGCEPFPTRFRGLIREPHTPRDRYGPLSVSGGNHDDGPSTAMLADGRMLPEFLRGPDAPASRLQPHATLRPVGRLADGRCPPGVTARRLGRAESAGSAPVPRRSAIRPLSVRYRPEADVSPLDLVMGRRERTPHSTVDRAAGSLRFRTVRFRSRRIDLAPCRAPSKPFRPLGGSTTRSPMRGRQVSKALGELQHGAISLSALQGSCVEFGTVVSASGRKRTLPSDARHPEAGSIRRAPRSP